MASEATLKLILLGIDKSATRTMRGVGNEAEKTSSKMSHFGKAGKWAAAGVAAGLVAATGAAIAFGKSAINAYKSVAQESTILSRTTGLSIKQASELRFAAHESGLEFKSLATSTKIFSKNLAAASTDQKKFTAMNKQLGFSIKDAQGHLLPMSKLLPKVADRFKQMPNGPQKTALAMKLFGKSGADMVKLLNKGGDGLKKFADQADKTGNAINNTDAYKKQIKAQREFDASITGLKIQLGQALYPALAAISAGLRDNLGPAITKMLPTIRKFGDWIREHIVPAVKELADKYLTSLVDGFKKLQPHLKELQPYFNAFATVLTKVVLPAMGKLYSVAFPALGYALAGIAIALGKVAKAGVWMWNNVLQPVFKFFAQAIGKVLGGLSDMFGALSHVPKMGWAKGVARDLRTAANAANDVADGINKIPSHKTVHFSLDISAKDRWLLANPTASPVLRSLITGHKAAGGLVQQAGVYDVGEVGRERVFLPRGAMVQSTASMQREGSSNVSSPAPIVININGVGFDKTHAAKEIVSILKGAGVSTGSVVLA